jgi:hypothetical protein
MKDACNRHHKSDGISWWEFDARGIPLCRVCPDCMGEKLRRYRPEVLSDPNYEASEPIEEHEALRRAVAADAASCSNEELEAAEDLFDRIYRDATASPIQGK